MLIAVGTLCLVEMTSTSTSSNRSFSEIVSGSMVLADDEVLSPSKYLETEGESCNEPTTYTEINRMIGQILDITRQNYRFTENPATQEAVYSLETELQNLRASIQSPSALGLLENIRELNRHLSNSLAILPSTSTGGVSLELKEKIDSLHKKITDSQPHARYDDDDKGESEAFSDGAGDDEEKEKATLNLDDIVLQLKYGREEEFTLALTDLTSSLRERVIGNEWIADEGIIPILFNRLDSGESVRRWSIIKVLRGIALENTQCKEKMVDVNCLTTLVKSLARDTMERREAVGLLAELCQLSSVKRRIGRIKGCILLLVAILNGDDKLAAHDAQNLLNTLSNNTQNALLMAEAGYFTPLTQHLKEGSEMSKILMATSLSRTDLTDDTRASLGENGAVQALVIMFKTGKLETKLAALTTLQSLSILKQNVSLMINSGILPPLLELLFSVTSSLMSLREPASALLASMARSESVLRDKNIADQMLSLLNLSSPETQSHLLEAVQNITTHTATSSKVRIQMRHNGAIQLLLPFLAACSKKVRINALNVLRTITDDVPEDLAQSLGENNIRIIVNLISSSMSVDTETTEAAVGLLSNIPVGDKKATEILKSENLLPILVSMMNSNSSRPGTTTSLIEESVASIIIRFTLPSDGKLQLYAADVGVIPLLVRLVSTGSVIAKSRAATSLSQLSQNSLSLRKPRPSKWTCYLPRFGDDLCSVHKIHCSIKGNFCLIKAGAVAPLIRSLEDKERGADEAILGALSTLLKDGLWQDGSYVIVGLSGVDAIVNILEFGTFKAQEKALWILERIFGAEDHRIKYGEFSQRVLIDLAQKGDLSLKPKIAKLLALLELLQVQSTYF